MKWETCIIVYIYLLESIPLNNFMLWFEGIEDRSSNKQISKSTNDERQSSDILSLHSSSSFVTRSRQEDGQIKEPKMMKTRRQTHTNKDEKSLHKNIFTAIMMKVIQDRAAETFDCRGDQVALTWRLTWPKETYRRLQRVDDSVKSLTQQTSTTKGKESRMQTEARTGNVLLQHSMLSSLLSWVGTTRRVNDRQTRSLCGHHLDCAGIPQMISRRNASLKCLTFPSVSLD